MTPLERIHKLEELNTFAVLNEGDVTWLTTSLKDALGALEKIEEDRVVNIDGSLMNKGKVLTWTAELARETIKRIEKGKE